MRRLVSKSENTGQCPVPASKSEKVGGVATSGQGKASKNAVAGVQRLYSCLQVKPYRLQKSAVDTLTVELPYLGRW